MTKITAIFSDVGGVLGTNGWDRTARERSAEEFKLDWLDFEDRHELVVNAFEMGRLSLDDYLDRTVFYRPRDFSKQRFEEFMLSQSKPFPRSLDLYARLAGAGKYLMATLNNESLELNLRRIELFGLRKYFSVFFSSCFLGMKKPHDDIYRLALKLTQRQPEECLFVDDRLLNVERARECRMNAIHCQDPSLLEAQMREMGLDC
ncbi:MAG: HAD family phosphatase [Acidobacteriota bacterium]|nr:HAD family phosphatase [Acidobacteriota bacterium]